MLQSLKKAHPGISGLGVTVYKLVWNWITVYPLEFNMYCRTTKATELSDVADQIFDLFYGLADSSKKKHVLWPAMTMMVILSTESLHAAVAADKTAAARVSKKVCESSSYVYLGKDLI